MAGRCLRDRHHPLEDRGLLRTPRNTHGLLALPLGRPWTSHLRLGDGRWLWSLGLEHWGTLHFQWKRLRNCFPCKHDYHCLCCSADLIPKIHHPLPSISSRTRHSQVAARPLLVLGTPLLVRHRRRLPPAALPTNSAPKTCPRRYGSYVVLYPGYSLFSLDSPGTGTAVYMALPHEQQHSRPDLYARRSDAAAWCPDGHSSGI